MSATSGTTTSSSGTAAVPSTYSDAALQAALDGLLEGSQNAAHDARHMFGYNDPQHKLSMLQRITATRILDYQALANSAANDDNNDGGEVTNQQSRLTALEAQATAFSRDHGPILPLHDVIASVAPRMALAAEFKRASPSKGAMAALDLPCGPQAATYATAGANVISVLTEPRWFHGSLYDMEQARLATTSTTTEAQATLSRPAILRKDFVVSKEMIAEAAAHGADTILLIVAVLPQHLLQTLIEYARSTFGMEPLVEVHADVEVDVALSAGARVIGVNNRNLHTFAMDLRTSERVADLLRTRGLTVAHDEHVTGDITLCALSGMSTAADVHRFRQAGVGMCLIGESLMRAADPAQAIAGLCLHPDDYEKQQEAATTAVGGAYTGGCQLVKVCGITRPEDALTACRAGANLIGVIFVPKSKRCATAAQAQAVVQAVRTFGERSDRVTLPAAPTTASPLVSLATTSQQLATSSVRPLVVGVFQNQDDGFIRQMVEECGLDLVQLHGQEGFAAARRDNYKVPVIRVVDIVVDPVTGQASENAVETILQSVTSDPAAILLDTSIKGQKEGGGTSTTFDWSIAERVQARGLPVLIAGGLTASTVADCVKSTRPLGVDVSSGVEDSPGIKDQDKVNSFVRNALQAASDAQKGF